MQRRDFFKASATGAAIALAPSTFLTGCSPDQVVQDVEGVLKESASITAAAGQTAWSADFTLAANALQAAYNVWDDSVKSTTGQKVAAMLNALVAATAVILPTDPYAPLINELVALVDLALNFWPASVAVSAIRNPHIGAVPPPKSYDDAKRRWNTLAVGSLAAARIR
jgi:hypothetical protein